MPTNLQSTVALYKTTDQGAEYKYDKQSKHELATSYCMQFSTELCAELEESEGASASSAVRPLWLLPMMSSEV